MESVSSVTANRASRHGLDGDTSAGGVSNAVATTADLRSVAFAFYLLFTISWFVHLPERVSALSVVRFDLITIVIITALILVSPSTQVGRLSETAVHRTIVIFLLYVCATFLFVEWPGTVVRYGLPRLVKALVFYFFTVQLITTQRRLSAFLFVFVCCQSVRVLEPLYLNLTQGYWGSAASMDVGSMRRLSGAPGDVVNPNGLAFVIVTVIPFMHYVWTLRAPGLMFYVLVLPALIYALMLTGSRSGLVAFAVTLGMIWWNSSRKLLIAALVLAGLAVAVPQLNEDQRDRYLSIVSSDTRNFGTAQGRASGIVADFEVAMRRPLFGHGLGTSREANAHYRGYGQLSHNLVTEVLQEVGIVGLAIFLRLLWSISFTVRDALRSFRESGSGSPLLVRLSLALQTWFLMNCFFSMFTYGLSLYNWYFAAGLALVLVALSAQETRFGDPSPDSLGEGVAAEGPAEQLRSG
jgi:O-antigen ligase